MEEEKAAAYYDELTRKGEGAARFKQGLGFSSAAPNSDPFPSKPRSSSLFSTFVRASSPSAKSPSPDDPHRKQARLEIIQHKLKRDHRRRSPSPPPDRDLRRRRSPSRSPDRRRSRDREERRRRSPSRERRRDSDRLRRSSDRDEDFSYSRSRRPCRDSRGEDRKHRDSREKEADRDKHRSSKKKSGGDGVDYSQLIEGYSKMTPAERVKAKMKLQLSETAAKDTDKGSGWERFDFNKEAPLDDDDDEIEAADDDAALVKEIGKSFRFSAVEAKREEEIKAAHDNAMFGAPAASTASPVPEIECADDNVTEDAPRKTADDVLISDKVIARQQSSWRDRARRFRNDSES